MTLRIERILNPPDMPTSYVTLAVYGGTSRFPLSTFVVLEIWWEAFKQNPELLLRG